MYPFGTREPLRRAANAAQRLPDPTKLPANRLESRRPDSNRGPLHYELWAAVTTSHRESPQVTRHGESAGQEMTHDDPS
jgi:hypothetical protein